MNNLTKELILPCGAKLHNRINKSAMSENMSPKNHRPNESILQVYQRWADGGAGLIITGNIMIDRKAIAEPGNILVEDKTDVELLKQWANVVKNTRLHLWAQINHPVQQSIVSFYQKTEINLERESICYA